MVMMMIMVGMVMVTMVMMIVMMAMGMMMVMTHCSKLSRLLATWGSKSQAQAHRLLGSNCLPMARLVTHSYQPHHGVAGIHAATHSPVQPQESQHPRPVAQPQQQQGVADIHAAITPTAKTAFTKFLESVKLPEVHWRNVLNNHNTKRPHGDFVNAPIRETIECRQVWGGWLATLDWPNSYRRGDGQPVQASSGVCESRDMALSMVCREMFVTLLLRAPPDQERGDPWVRICDGPFIQGAVEQIRQRVRELREEVAGTLVATPGDAAPVTVPTTTPAPALAPNTSLPVKSPPVKAPHAIAVPGVYLHPGVAGNAVTAPAHDQLRPPPALAHEVHHVHHVVDTPVKAPPATPAQPSPVHRPGCWCEVCREAGGPHTNPAPVAAPSANASGSTPPMPTRPVPGAECGSSGEGGFQGVESIVAPTPAPASVQATSANASAYSCSWSRGAEAHPSRWGTGTCNWHAGWSFHKPRHQRGHRRSWSPDERLSRALAKILRHTAHDEGIEIDVRGYAYLAYVSRFARKERVGPRGYT